MHDSTKTPRRNFVVALFVVAVAPAALVFSPSAQAGAVVGATEMTQIANNIELVMQYIQQMESYAAQLRQWELQINQFGNQVQNTLNFPAQVWGRIQYDLQGVARIAQAGKALAYSASNLGDKFTMTYKGFQYPAGFNYKREYAAWSKTSMDTIKGAMDAIGLQASHFVNEDATMQQLQEMSLSSEGQMQALQVGAQIAGEQVLQLQKLRQLMMTQATAENAYKGRLQAQADTTAASADAVFTLKPPTGPNTQFRGGTR